jgi:hypothetical protein
VKFDDDRSWSAGEGHGAGTDGRIGATMAKRDDLRRGASPDANPSLNAKDQSSHRGGPQNDDSDIEIFPADLLATPTGFEPVTLRLGI